MFTILCILILVILVVSTIVFISLFVKCHNKDKFCSADNPKGDCCGTCQGMDKKVFTNRPLLHKLYNSGQVTENSFRTRNDEDVKKKRVITENDILDKYYNRGYYNNGKHNGKPKGGILISMIDTHTLCPNYVYSGSHCLKDISECYWNDILDITNITKLLDKLRKSQGTSCYAVDNTYFRSDLPNYVYGPFTGTDINIGLILDLQKIWDYVACMFSIDSGSVSRYNNCCDNSNDCVPNIDASSWIGKGEKGWNDYLKSKNSTGLAMAGCGKAYGDDGICHSGLKNNAAEWIIHDTSKAQEHVKNVSDYINKKNIINEWAFGEGNAPFSKYQWKLWVEQVKNVYDMANTHKFIVGINSGSNIVEGFTNSSKKEKGGGDIFRENEVDIIVPNYPRNNKNNTTCRVTEEFKQVWINSIMGVVTNAKYNCIKNNKIVGCNDTNCCCSENFSKQLAKHIADKFNENDNTNHKIQAYTIDTINITNFNWEKGKLSELNLQKI